MAFVSALRDRIAGGHYAMAARFGKTVSILDQNGSTITGWTDLACIARSAAEAEVEKFGGAWGATADKVFEIARQGSFVGTAVQLQFHKIKYGATMYEIVSIQSDDAETLSSDNLEDAAVFLFFCKKMVYGRTEMPT